MELIPYIFFNGTCEKALKFYAKVLNGEIKELKRYESAPDQIFQNEGNRVLHAQFRADNLILMAADNVSGDIKEGGGMMNLSLVCDNEMQGEKIFTELSKEGKVTMPYELQFWGAKLGMLIDKFGVHWMISSEPEKN